MAPNSRGQKMAPKIARDVAHENVDRMTDAASSGGNWMAQFTDFNLRQSMAALDSMLSLVRRSAEGFGQQAAMMRQHAVGLAEQAVENTSEFSNRIIHIKDPLEWAQVQSEYLSGQAHAFAEGNRKLGEAMMREQGEMAGEVMKNGRAQGAAPKKNGRAQGAASRKQRGKG
jgi:hypothetical protein